MRSRQTTKVPSVYHEHIAFQKMGFARAWPQSNVISAPCRLRSSLDSRTFSVECRCSPQMDELVWEATSGAEGSAVANLSTKNGFLRQMCLLKCLRSATDRAVIPLWGSRFVVSIRV